MLTFASTKLKIIREKTLHGQRNEKGAHRRKRLLRLRQMHANKSFMREHSIKVTDEVFILRGCPGSHYRLLSAPAEIDFSESSMIENLNAKKNIDFNALPASSSIQRQPIASPAIHVDVCSKNKIVNKQMINKTKRATRKERNSANASQTHRDSVSCVAHKIPHSTSFTHGNPFQRMFECHCPSYCAAHSPSSTPRSDVYSFSSQFLVNKNWMTKNNNNKCARETTHDSAECNKSVWRPESHQKSEWIIVETNAHSLHRALHHYWLLLMTLWPRSIVNGTSIFQKQKHRATTSLIFMTIFFRLSGCRWSEIAKFVRNRFVEKQLRPTGLAGTADHENFAILNRFSMI